MSNDERSHGRDNLESAAAASMAPSMEELRAAAALQKALAAPEEGLRSRGAESRWLAAHLRFPAAEDSLGDVRAWRLARAARESVQLRRGLLHSRSRKRNELDRASRFLPLWWIEPLGRLNRVGRALTSTGGLLGAAALLLITSWLLVGQAGDPNPRRLPSIADSSVMRIGRGTSGGQAAQAWMYKHSFVQNESPAQRIELMIQARLAVLRSRADAPSLSGPSRRSFVGAELPVSSGTMP